MRSTWHPVGTKGVRGEFRGAMRRRSVPKGVFHGSGGTVTSGRSGRTAAPSSSVPNGGGTWAQLIAMGTLENKFFLNVILNDLDF